MTFFQYQEEENSYENQQRWKDFGRWNVLCVAAENFSQHFDEDSFRLSPGNAFFVRVAYRHILQVSFPFFKITLTYTYSNKLPVLYELTHLSIITPNASMGADYSIQNTECFSLSMSSELFLSSALMAPIDLHMVSLCSERDCKFSAKGQEHNVGRM